MCLVSIHELIQRSRNKKSDNCDAFLSVFEAERLLCEVIEVDRAWLRTHPEYILSSKQKSQYLEFKARRERGEPISYIIGRQGFWNLELKVNENVLIPRPESELIIEIVLELPLKEHSLVLDLGTGSGALALALASEKSKWDIIGTDIYDISLQMAEAKIPLIIQVIAFWIIVFPIAYVMSLTNWVIQPLGIYGFWIGCISAVTLAGIGLIFRWNYVSKKAIEMHKSNL